MATLSHDEIESLADRAAEDGEHSIVAACQTLLRSQVSDDDEQRAALRTVRRYLRSISGR